MPAKVFFDTTILIYSVSSNDPRAAVAEQLLEAGGQISVQVLNEFASVARRKLHYSWDQVQSALDAFTALCSTPQPLTLKTHQAAIRVAKRYGFSIYDSLIIASATEAGCTILYSEDMQHGQAIGTLRIQNPFRTK